MTNGRNPRDKWQKPLRVGGISLTDAEDALKKSIAGDPNGTFRATGRIQSAVAKALARLIEDFQPRARQLTS